MLAVFAVAGCAVDQNKEVAIYRDVLETTAPAAVVVELKAGEHLSLKEAMAIACKDNERLALAGESYLQALIAKDMAFSTFLPTIGLAPAFMARENFNTMGMPSVFTPTHTQEMPVNAGMNVFNGFSDSARLKSAGMSAEERKQSLLDLQSTILIEVAQAYYGVMKAEKAVEVLSNSLNVQETRVEDVRRKVTQGVARQLDLEQSRAQAAATKVQLNDATRGAAIGRVTLAMLMGVSDVPSTLKDEVTAPEESPPVDDLMKTAGERRRDLLAAGQLILAARQAVEAAVGQYYPSISVNFQEFLYKDSFPEDSQFLALFQANLPIFSAGRIEASVRAAWSQYRQAAQAESFLKKSIAREVKVARIEFENNGQQVKAINAQVEATREAFRISSEAYANGLATNLDRLDAQDRYLSAQLRLASEGFDRSLNYLKLVRIVGQMEGENAGIGGTGNKQ